MEYSRIVRKFVVYNERVAVQTPEEALSVVANGQIIYNPWSKDGRSLSDGEAVETYGLEAVSEFMEEAGYAISRYRHSYWEKIEAILHKDGASMEACEEAVRNYRGIHGDDEFTHMFTERESEELDSIAEEIRRDFLPKAIEKYKESGSSYFHEHAPSCPVIRKCDLHPSGENEKRVRRNEDQDYLMGERLEDYCSSVEELPYIGSGEVEKLEQCSLEIGEAEGKYYPSSGYVWEGKLYQDDIIVRFFLKDGRKYIVEVQNLPDPSCGLFGAFGSWTPYRTVLYDGDGNEIAEHAEIQGADFGRIDAVMKDREQLLRWLTLHRMIRSDYAQRISEINERLCALWKTYFDTQKILENLYYQRLGCDPKKGKMWLAFFDKKKSYEDFIEGRKDLFFSDKE